MLIYIAVALFPLLVGMYYNARIGRYLTEEEAISKKYLRKRWTWLLVAAFPMFALIAFRGPYMGADTVIYLKFFRQMVDTPWNKIFIENAAGPEFEPGYVIFEKLITYITSSPQVYQIIYTSIYCVSIVSFANEMKNHSFSFLYFFATMGTYTFMFTGVRQCLAMSICLLSYRFVKRRKLIPFLVLVMLATSFHMSGLFFLPIYFIYNRKFNIFNCFIYVVGIVIIFWTRDLWSEWLWDVFEYNADQSTSGSGLIFFLVMCCVTVFAIVTLVIPKKLDAERLGYFNVNLIAWLFWLLRTITLSAERPSLYYLFFSSAILCYALDAPPKSRDRVIYKIAVYSAFVILFAYRLLTGHAALVPYTSFF